MRKARSLVLASVAVAAALAPARPAAAPPCVEIHRILYRPAGGQTGTNTSLNNEWIELTNRCTAGVSLQGWRVKDASNITYVFGGYTLRAGRAVRIHSGRGTNSSTDLYWGRTWYVWNDDRDKAKLLNGARTITDRCTYVASAANLVYC